MPASITVLFPNEADAKYDIKYYKAHHMPLIEKLWGHFGIISWSVTNFTPGPDGSGPAFTFGSVVNWASAEAIKAAFADESVKQIMEDVPNFSNKHPTFLFGDVSARTQGETKGLGMTVPLDDGGKTSKRILGSELAALCCGIYHFV